MILTVLLTVAILNCFSWSKRHYLFQSQSPFFAFLSLIICSTVHHYFLLLLLFWRKEIIKNFYILPIPFFTWALLSHYLLASTSYLFLILFHLCPENPHPIPDDQRTVLLHASEKNGDMSHSWITFRLIMVVCSGFMHNRRMLWRWLQVEQQCAQHLTQGSLRTKHQVLHYAPTLLTLRDSELVLHSLNSWSLYTWTLSTLTSLLPSAAATDETKCLKKPIFEMSYLSFPSMLKDVDEPNRKDENQTYVTFSRTL